MKTDYLIAVYGSLILEHLTDSPLYKIFFFLSATIAFLLYLLKDDCCCERKGE